MADFQWALEQLKQGKRVRATYWSEWGLYIYMEHVKNKRWDQHIVLLRTIDGESLIWRSRPYDEASAEWVIATDAMVAELTEMQPQFYWRSGRGV